MLFYPPYVPAISIGKFRKRHSQNIAKRNLPCNHAHPGISWKLPSVDVPGSYMPGELNRLWDYDHKRIQVRTAHVVPRNVHCQTSPNPKRSLPDFSALLGRGL
jgi:hypothetical protein